MYVKIRRHQHTRVHAHTGPRRHARASGVSQTPGLSAGRHSTQTTVGNPSLCVYLYISSNLPRHVWPLGPVRTYPPRGIWRHRCPPPGI